VAAGDTWASIAQKVYGDSYAADALQQAVGNITLVAGLRLTGIPPVLNYTTKLSRTQTDIVDPLGQTATYVTDAAGLLREMRSPVNAVGDRQVTKYEYDAAGNLEKVIDPNGNEIASRYDDNGNLKWRRDAKGNTASYTYNQANQLLSETVYLVPDPDGGGAQQPGEPRTTNYIYDAQQHLRYVISPEGRVRRFDYDAAGNRICETTYVKDNYAYSVYTLAAANDWTAKLGDLRGKVERVEYGYDFRGNVSRRTAFATVAADGSGVADAAASVTQYVYDQRGNLLQTIDPRGSASTADGRTASLAYATTYTYDGMGRVLSVQQWESVGTVRSTLTSYNDKQNSVVHTLANGLATTSTYDRRGLLTAVTQADGGKAFVLRHRPAGQPQLHLI
jgi:YD repeat-containing protein